MTKSRIDKHTQIRREKQQEERTRARLRAQGKLQEARDRWRARIVGEVAMDVLSCLQVNGADLTDEAIRDDIIKIGRASCRERV